MLKHGRAGVPMEVMGLMLGEFVDDYTVRVIDVFAMPQSGTVSSRPMYSFVPYQTNYFLSEVPSMLPHLSELMFFSGVYRESVLKQ